MWKPFLLAAIDAGTGYLAGCMKKKRDTRNPFPQKKEEVQSSLYGEGTGLCGDGLSGHKTIMPQFKISHVDNYGYLQYQLDLLEKEHDEKCAKFEKQLKSVEAKLCAKDIQLGEDSPTLEMATNANGIRQYILPSAISAQVDDPSHLPFRQRRMIFECHGGHCNL